MIKQKTKNMHDLTSWAARLTLRATSIHYLEPYVLLRVTGGLGTILGDGGVRHSRSQPQAT